MPRFGSWLLSAACGGWPAAPAAADPPAAPPALIPLRVRAADEEPAKPADETLPSPRRLPPDPVPGKTDPLRAVRPLSLEEVIASVENHYPLLFAALQEQGITSGQLLTAQGAFDLNLRAREFWQVGTYDSHRSNV